MLTQPRSPDKRLQIIADRWRVEALLSKGRNGSVSLVRDATGRLSGAFALKMVTERDAKPFFDAEKRALQVCHHPHIVSLIDSGLSADGGYLVTPFVEEGTLRDNKVSISDGKKIVRQLASALYQIHTQGIFHRDISPDNILLRNNKVSGPFAILCDFGLVHFADKAEAKRFAAFDVRGLGSCFLSLYNNLKKTDPAFDALLHEMTAPVVSRTVSMHEVLVCLDARG